MQILVTELGDETFIIAAIMAMRHPRLVVYAGAMSALGFMTVPPPSFLGLAACQSGACHPLLPLARGNLMGPLSAQCSRC